MIEELIRAFLLIFAAEMGDKTQIIAMTFATQYLVKEVIMGVTIGVLFNHGIAILLGSFISKIIPMDLIQIIAGFLFIVFGINALKYDEEDEVENKKALSPIVTVALAFFIGELGDKTQLTAMTLSAEASYPLFILMGTTLGMIATSGLGIFVGSKIGNKIPEMAIKIASSLVFVFFGTIKLFNTLPEIYLKPINIVIFLTAIGSTELLLINRLMREKRKFDGNSPLRDVAENLYKQTQLLKESLDDLCLGEDKCGKCSGVGCLLGYTRDILRDARERNDYFNSLNIDTDKLIKKEYDKNKVIDALALIISDFENYGWENDEEFVIIKVKSSLEIYLFGHKLRKVKNTKEYINEVGLHDKNIRLALRKKL